MKTKTPLYILAASVLMLAGILAAGGVQAAEPLSQPADEVAAQKLLPKVHDALWTALSKCNVGYDDKSGNYSIKTTPEVEALSGQSLTVRGFILPMDGSDRTKHFLVTRNTPVCMVCPPGQPNEVIEVYASQPIAWTDKIVAVTGKFSLINNGEQALFFKMENASVK